MISRDATAGRCNAWFGTLNFSITAFTSEDARSSSLSRQPSGRQRLFYNGENETWGDIGPRRLAYDEHWPTTGWLNYELRLPVIELTPCGEVPKVLACADTK